MESIELDDAILGEVQLPQDLELAQSSDPCDLVLRNVELFEPHVVKALDLPDLVAAEGQDDETLVELYLFDHFDLIRVQEQVLEVWVLLDSLDFGDLVVRVVHPFEVGWWGEVKHLGDAVVACIQLHQVLDVGEGSQGGQVVV